MKKYFKYFLLGVVLLMVVILGCLKVSLNKEANVMDDELFIEEDNQPEEKDVVEEIRVVSVDIKGAVAIPGVYELENNKRVIDVVNLAGGFTEEANTSFVNLAKNVSDEMVVIIYTNDEIKEATKEDKIARLIDNSCVCPKISNDGCLYKNNDSNSQSGSDSVSSGSDEVMVNINTANLEELKKLSGIGESKAQAIISYREENGNFGKIEDIMNVTGIGEELFKKIQDYITV